MLVRGLKIVASAALGIAAIVAYVMNPTAEMGLIALVSVIGALYLIVKV